MHQRRAHDTMPSHRPQAAAANPANIDGKAHRLSGEAFTLAFYASVAVAGLLSLVGTVAYGYLLILDLL